MIKRNLYAICLAAVMTVCVGCGANAVTDSAVEEETEMATTEETAEETTEPTTEKPTQKPTQAPTEYKSVSRNSILADDPVMYFVDSNSVGGLVYLWADKYIGTKSIKYAKITVSMYNSVDDPAYDDIRMKNSFDFQLIGPIEQGDWIMLYSSEDDPDIYCNICTKIKIDSVELEYMDGSKEKAEYGWSVNQQSEYSESSIWLSIRDYHQELYNFITGS